MLLVIPRNVEDPVILIQGYKVSVDDELRHLFSQSSFYAVQWQEITSFGKPAFHEDFGLGQGRRVFATALKRLRDLRQV